MGFFKVLAGVGAGIGAVVLAPVALPAIAVAGATAAATAGAAAATVAATAATAAGTVAAAAGATAATIGTAATAVGTAAASTAVGSAIVSGATAVGTAATGAIGAAGSAIAGTAVGGAALGAMETVGVGIGTAAAGLSSAPVIGTAATTVAAMAGETAGATALGTIATTGAIGAANGISGAAKLSEAKEVKDSAMDKYHAECRTLEKRQDEVNKTLENLGAEKAKIMSAYERFASAYSKIKNLPKDQKFNVGGESISITPENLDHLKAVAISAKSLLAGGIGSIAAGNLIGLATSGGVISGITVASTGTAISSLSGAAASNAILAALGGGTLKAGGAGIAGGTLAMSGLTVAPMLMVGGIVLNHKAKEALANAEDISNDVDYAVSKMQKERRELDKVERLSRCIKIELQEQYAIYSELMDELENIVALHTDFRLFGSHEITVLEKSVLSITLLKLVSEQNILDSNDLTTVLESEVLDVLEKSKTCRDTKLQYI